MPQTDPGGQRVETNQVFVFWGCFSNPIIGLMIPLIPQVPFLIASLLFFAGCIPGLRRWLVNTKFFKKYILPHVRKDKYLQEILLEVK